MHVFTTLVGLSNLNWPVKNLVPVIPKGFSY